MKKMTSKKYFSCFYQGRIHIFLYVFCFVLAGSFLTILYLHSVKSANLNYAENFTTTTYKDTANSTGKWDTALGQARLLGKDWVNMEQTKDSAEEIAANSNGSDILFDSANNPYLVWAEDKIGHNEIYFKKWTPGVGWTKMDGTVGIENISNGPGSMPQIQLDASNNPYIIWGSAGDIYFTKWTPALNAWTKADGITLGSENISNTTNAGQPQLQINSLGEPYMVWNDGSTGTTDTYFSKWTPAANAWTKMDGITPGYDNLSNNPGETRGPAMRINSANIPLIVWEDFTTGQDIYFVKWTANPVLCAPNSTCWTNMAGTVLGYENLSNDLDGSGNNHLLIDSLGNPYIIWSGSFIYFTKWTTGLAPGVCAGGATACWTKADGATPGRDNIGGIFFPSYQDFQLDNSKNPNIVWQDTGVGGRTDIYFSKWTPALNAWTYADGVTLGVENITNDAVDSSYAKLQLTAVDVPLVIWNYWDAGGGGVGKVLFTKWTAGVGWTKMDGINPAPDILYAGSSSVSSVMEIDSNNIPYVIFHDVLGVNWLRFIKWLPVYNSTSTIQSLNINTSSDFIASAKLSATQTLNGQTIDYYLSNDGGVTWESVTSGVWHSFTSTGTDLRWRADLATSNPAVTPVIDDLALVYKTKTITCNLTPNNLQTGDTVTINAHVTFSATSVWAEIENNGTLLNTVNLTDLGSGDYSSFFAVNSSYVGQNEVAVFASDGTDTYTCNASTGVDWQKMSISDIAWPGRSYHAAVSFGGKLWILGGFTDEETNDVWSSVDGLHWDLVINNAPWHYRRGHVAIVFNNKIWVMGGFWGTGNFLNDIWSTTDGINWVQERINADWSGRVGLNAATFDNKLWVSAGCDHQSPNCDHGANDVWYSSNGINWTQATAVAPWSGRAFSNMISFDEDGAGSEPEKLWIMGGQAYPGGVPTQVADIWSSPDGVNWVQRSAAAAWGVRATHGVLKYNAGSGEKLWLMGGMSNTAYLNDIWSSSDGVNWSLVIDPPDYPGIGTQPSKWTNWDVRRLFATAIFDDGTGEKMWVLGGWDNKKNLNDVWYSADGLNWSLKGSNYEAEFGARFETQLIPFNNKLWLFGGFTERPKTVANDIWSSTDGIHWQCEVGPYTLAVEGIQCNNPTPPVIWSGRWGHRVLVYNNKLYLIGGCTNINNLPLTVWCDTGSVRDVWSSTDGINWTQETAAGAFLNRYLFTASVYDNKMWVMGGIRATAHSYLNDVWYSTNGSTWTAAPNAAWSARGILNSTAFDDGSGEKLYVMAGADNLIRYSDVWVTTDPITQPWTRLTAAAGWPAVYGGGIANYDDKLWMLFGNRGTNPFGSKEVWNSPDGANWTLVNATPIYYARDFGTTAVYNDRIWIAAGDFSGGEDDAVWASKYNSLIFNVTISGSIGTSLPSAVPLAPQSLSCETPDSHTIRWNFTDRASNETGFKLYGPEGLILDTGQNVVTDISYLTEIDLQPNTQYQGRYVKTFNANGESGPSNTGSCYTMANSPLPPIIGEATGNSIVVKINLADNNPPNTEYVIKELNSDEYINPDGTFSLTENWQTYEGWGGEAGIRVTGNPVPASNFLPELGTENIISYSNSIMQFKISLIADQTYNFAVKARNGDGVETAISGGTTGTTSGAPVPAPIPSETPPATPPETPPAIPPEIPPETPPVPPTPPETPPVPPTATPPEIPLTTPPAPLVPPAPSISPLVPGGNLPVIGSVISAINQNETTKYLQEKFLDNPQVETASQNVVTPALVVLAIINTMPAALAVTVNVLPYLHLVFFEPLLMLFRKKRKKWGVVYDALTKLPIGLAVVRLYSKKDNRLIQTKVTDKEGRYILIVKEPGRYYLSVTKPEYNYPTRYLRGDVQDVKYLDLYHGEEIEVKEKEGVVTANIPLDPKERRVLTEKEAIRSYLLKNSRLVVSYLGMILALLIILINPTAITIGSFVVHIVLYIIFRRLLVPPKPRSWGIVYDEKTKEPLTYAIVRIFETRFNKLLETQVTDAKGRYAFLVGKNQYQLLTEKQGYQKKEIKPVDLIKKEAIVNLDIGLEKLNKVL